MGKKFEINSLLKNNILIDKKNGLSIRNIGEKYCLNKNVVLRIIKNDNQNKEPNVEYLVCKKTNKIFYNINNKSGILSKHLKKYYSDFSLKDLDKYFTIHHNNKNYISFKSYLNKLRIKFNEKIVFNGLIKFTFNNKNRFIFFVENDKIVNNIKIKPILFFKLKNRYDNSIFIFEDEWVNKQNIVKNKIKIILNIFKAPKIYARNCTIKEITPQIKNLFLNKNHIQGTANSKISLGAFYNDKLVAVMCFTDNRNMTKDIIKFDYDLNRFATDNNYHIIGIGGKLFKHFLKLIEKNSIIVSYGDRRHVLSSQNNIYKNLNFKLNQITKHDFMYKDNKSINRIHKITMQLRFKKTNLDIKENEYYKDLGYKKIWDCGKYRFTYINN